MRMGFQKGVLVRLPAKSIRLRELGLNVVFCGFDSRK